jgi:sec-independent protein translocase protein TatC
MADEALPFTVHLEELRKRLIRAVAAWLVGFLACYGYAERLFQFIADPVRAALPEGSSLVFINATEPFFTYLRIGAMAGLMVALPVILWQIWGFVAPGLHCHEKRFAVPFVLAGCLCFGAGFWFGFTKVFPTIFTFLVRFGTGTGEIDAMLSMGAYLSLAGKLLLAFGLVFELPIVIFFLARMGVVDHLWLRGNRKYALVLAFIIGAILTPPDVFSQAALAIPFILLYEVGIWLAFFFGKKKPGEGAGERDEVPAAG